MSDKTLFSLIYLAAILVIAAIGYLLDPDTYRNQVSAEEDAARQLSLRQKISTACWFVTMAGIFILIFLIDDEPTQNADLYTTIYSH